ncbi:MAG: S41 family peptidase [Bacteroidota bacterium]
MKIKIRSLLLIPLIMYSCNSVKEYPNDAREYDQQIIEQLRSFNKLYGSVKYFHPSDEAAELDWDAFSVYGVDKILKSNSADFECLTKELFMPIAPSLEIINNKGRQSKAVTGTIRNKRQDIYWQHLGNGNFKSDGPYKSLRVNRPRLVYPDYLNSQSLSLQINTRIFPGSYKILVTSKNVFRDSYFRGEVDLSLEDINGKFHYDGYQWLDTESFEEKGVYFDVLDTIKSVNINIVPKGRGRLIINDIEVVKINNYLNTTVWSKALDSVIINQNKDYDDVSNYAVALKNSSEFPAGSKIIVESQTSSLRDSALFDKHLTFGDYIEVRLSENLICIIPTVLQGDKKSTKPKTDIKKLSRLIDHLESISNSYNDLKSSKSLVIGNIINVWNVIRYFFPNYESIEGDWEYHFNQTISELIKSNDNPDFKSVLGKLLAKLNDSHVEIIERGYEDFYHPGIIVEPVDGKYIITKSVRRLSHLIGSQIISVDGNQIDSLVNEELALISYGAENFGIDAALNNILKRPTKKSLFVEIKSEQDQIQSELLFTELSDFKFFQLKAKTSGTSRHISDETFYLDLTTLDSAEFTQILPKLQDYSSIIIDLRGYPVIEGNYVEKFIGHFSNVKPVRDWLYIPQVLLPDDIYDKANYKGSQWEVLPMSPYLDSDIFFLIDHNAISYAESIVGYFEPLKNVTLIGSPTAGANGSALTYSLPGGYSYKYTGSRVVKHDGSRLHGIGFLPDVEVRPTIQGIIEGRDEVLEKAIELASANAKANEVGKENKD